jgi:hypothetical protein
MEQKIDERLNTFIEERVGKYVGILYGNKEI